MRILIVEDEPLTKLGLKQVCSRYEIVGLAGNGYEAVEISLRQTPDVIVTDIFLPKLDGIKMTEWVKKILPGVKVLIHTSAREFKNVSSAIAVADGYCLKGISSQQLFAALTTVASGATYLDSQVSQFLRQPHLTPINSITLSLSEREKEILECIVGGQSNQQIGNYLNLSPHTIKDYVRMLKEKLVVEERIEIATKALQFGLIN